MDNLSLSDRIREMSRYVDVEGIAKALSLPKELIDGVLAGQISDDVLDDYNPVRPPEIKIVEHKKIVRSMVTGIVSFGNSGATTLTSTLGTLAAENLKSEVVIADLNEYSNIGHTLGIPIRKNSLYPNLTGWVAAEDIQTTLVRHQDISNLFVLLGATTLNDYINIPIPKLTKVLEDLGTSFETVWVDCPATPHLWSHLFPYLDCICFIIEPTSICLSALWQTFTLLKPDPDKYKIILIEPSDDGDLTLADCSRLIKETTKIPIIGQLPQDSVVKKMSNQELNLVLNRHDSNYVNAAKKILDILMPVSHIARTSHRGFREGLRKLLSR